MFVNVKILCSFFCLVLFCHPETFIQELYPLNTGQKLKMCTEFLMSIWCRKNLCSLELCTCYQNNNTFTPKEEYFPKLVVFVADFYFIFFINKRIIKSGKMLIFPQSNNSREEQIELWCKFRFTDDGFVID